LGIAINKSPFADLQINRDLSDIRILEAHYPFDPATIPATLTNKIAQHRPKPKLINSRAKFAADCHAHFSIQNISVILMSPRRPCSAYKAELRRTHYV